MQIDMQELASRGEGRLRDLLKDGNDVFEADMREEELQTRLRLEDIIQHRAMPGATIPQRRTIQHSIKVHPQGIYLYCVTCPVLATIEPMLVYLEEHLCSPVHNGAVRELQEPGWEPLEEQHRTRPSIQQNQQRILAPPRHAPPQTSTGHATGSRLRRQRRGGR